MPDIMSGSMILMSPSSMMYTLLGCRIMLCLISIRPHKHDCRMLHRSCSSKYLHYGCLASISSERVMLVNSNTMEIL